MKGFNPNKLQGMLKQAQALQQKLAEVQGQAKNMIAEGSAGGGAVVATVNGEFEVETIKIDPQLLNPDDVELAQESVKSAINQAIKKVRELTDAEYKKVTGGMSIPGM